jgi:hypothetical protein
MLQHPALIATHPALVERVQDSIRTGVEAGAFQFLFDAFNVR